MRKHNKPPKEEPDYGVFYPPEGSTTENVLKVVIVVIGASATALFVFALITQCLRATT